MNDVESVNGDDNNVNNDNIKYNPVKFCVLLLTLFCAVIEDDGEYWVIRIDAVDEG